MLLEKHNSEVMSPLIIIYQASDMSAALCRDLQHTLQTSYQLEHTNANVITQSKHLHYQVIQCKGEKTGV